MKHRIVILGAGYTGAVAAGRVARRLHRDDVHVTLVNAEPDFVERVRMHQIAAGEELRERPLQAALAGTGVELRVARVTAVDADNRTVSVTGVPGDDELSYDTLVYALGSDADDHGVPGVAEHAHAVASRGAARRLRERLRGLAPGARLVVVGGGLTGIEAASELAESHPELDVSLVATGGFGDWLSEAGRRHLRGAFDRLGVAVHEHAEIVRVGAAGVALADGSELPADVTVWTAGFAAHPIAAASTLAVTDRGQIRVDATMRSVSHADVYAIGDAAWAMGTAGTPLRMSCASGIPTAWQAVDAIAARLTGGRLPHVPLAYVQQCISLGRTDGLIQLVTGDDRARRFALTGRLAARYKELVCRGAAWVTQHPTLGLPVRTRRVVLPAPAATPAAAVARPAATAQ